MIKELLLVAICFTVGFGVFLFLNPSAMTATQNFFSPIFTPIITGIGNIANAIPSPIKEILGIVSIPGIISAVFFGYTKLKAMQKLNEVQQQASQQVTNLSGQVAGATGTAEAVSGNLADKVSILSTDLASTRILLTEKQHEINDWETKQKIWDKTRFNLEEERRSLQAKVKDLQDKLDLATGVKKAPIT